MKRVRPRGLARYSEEIQREARESFIRFAFLSEGESYDKVRGAIRAGDHDDSPMVKMAAFILSETVSRDAGVKCESCGSHWDDDRLAGEKSKRPALRACCPERKMKPVVWRPI